MAEDQGRRFQWTKAAQSYAKCLSLIPRNDLAKRGEFFERIGFCTYRAAMQAKDSRMFRDRLCRSLSAYNNACTCLRGLGSHGKGFLFCCRSMEAYIGYWLAGRPSKKKQFLEESWNRAKKSLQFFETSGDDPKYAEAFTQLSESVAISFEYDWNLHDRVRKLREAVERGRRAIGIFESLRNKEGLARALARTALFLDALSDRLDPVELDEYQREALRLWKKAIRISRDIAFSETSRPPEGFYKILDQNQSLAISRKALEIVRRRRDRLATGWLINKLSIHTFWAADAAENPTTHVKLAVKALQLAEKAALHYDAINFTSPIGGVMWAHSPYTEHFMLLTVHETDPGKSHSLLEKGLRSTPELLRLARRSEYPDILHYAHHVTSKLEHNLAQIVTSEHRKRKLLHDALQHRIEESRILNQIEPSVSWSRGVALRYLADLQGRLAELEKNPRKKRELLFQAVLNKEKGLTCSSKFVQSLERSESHVLRGPLARYHHELGNLLLQLHSITNNERHLRKAATAYIAAADWFRKIPRYDRLAESHWKAAETYDQLQAYSIASDNFARASSAYVMLGRKVPQLNELAREYSRYLMAWSQIENARSSHITLKNDLASNFYDRAARLHGSTKRWGFLAGYYSAWSKLESGESLSRSGDHEEAMQVFNEAVRLFGKSRVSFKKRLAMLDRPDERTMVAKLATAPKQEYCQARITLEEAIAAETREDYRMSYEKFGLASEKLRKVAAISESKQDREETMFLSTLCQAWQLSSKAEIEGSTERLAEACALFGKARDTSPSNDSMKLASGHESFCKSLIASRNFADTLDPAFYEAALRNLDLAISHYLDSGFRTASEHATARKLLLESFSQLNDANNEKDPKKKAGLYRLTSTLLRESADAFLRAQQPARREHALRLLEKAKMESRLAIKTTEILETASEAPTNVAFHTPAQGDEKAVGLERFEHADIEARLASVTRRSGPSGDLVLEIEISNTGKQHIKLVRVDEAIPEGADLTEAPESWKTQGRSLSPAPRRIAPTKTETLKLVIRPKTEGLLRIEPKVIFVDENGLMSKRLMEPKMVPTSRIIEFLAASFVRDNLDRLLPANCGWRTLMEIVQVLKIPRSHVYGEARFGRTFGRHLDALVKSSFVEYRIFSGERGRGGNIRRVRISMGNEDVKKYVEQLTFSPVKIDSSVDEIMSPSEYAKRQKEMVLAR